MDDKCHCEPVVQQTTDTLDGKGEDEIQNVVDIDSNTSAVRRVAHRKLHLQHLQNRHDLDETVQIDEIVVKIVNILEKRKVHLLGHMESTLNTQPSHPTANASLRLQIRHIPSFPSDPHLNC